MESTPKVSYAELVRVFLRLSALAFGGPIAHIAMGEDEIVTRRQWLTREHYLDLIAATNLIPGPNSTEVMIHVGYVLRGIPGAVVAGMCFILPAFLLSLVLAVIYVQSGTIPQVEALLWGIQPVIVAIIANAGYRLGRSALDSVSLWIVFILAVVSTGLLNIPEVIVIIGAGVFYALYRAIQSGDAVGKLAFLMLLPTAQAAAAQVGVFDLFFYFLRIGSVLFGSGYVLIAYIQQDLVNTFGWLTTRQLLDAIAIGQITPGPVSTAATVVGYILTGVPGAIAATVGIFLPPFVLVILTAPLIPRMRQSRLMSAFLSGVNAGVIGAILVTLIDLAWVAVRVRDGDSISVLAVLMTLISLFALVRLKVNAMWLIAVGALIGLVVG